MHCMRNLWYFNRDYNWTVVTPMHKNWVPSCSLSCDELQYFASCAYSNSFIRYKHLFTRGQNTHFVPFSAIT